MNMFKSNGGFTLVELIVVIAILAILAGAAIPAYSGYIARANDSTVLAELEAVETAAFAAAALEGTTPVKIVIAPAPAEDAGDDAVAAGTVIAYIADSDDEELDVLDITEFYKGTVDLSKHSTYAEKGCTWYAVDQETVEEADQEYVVNPKFDSEKAADEETNPQTVPGVKGWNIGIGAKKG